MVLIIPYFPANAFVLAMSGYDNLGQLVRSSLRIKRGVMIIQWTQQNGCKWTKRMKISTTPGLDSAIRYYHLKPKVA